MIYQDSGYYDSFYIPSSGHTYRVEANVPEYGMLWAEDQIPEPVSINKATYSFTSGSDEEGGGLQKFSISWDDNSDLYNFYEFFYFILVNENGFLTRSYYSVGNSEGIDPAIQAEGDLNYYSSLNKGQIFSDATFNGRTYLFSTIFSTSWTPDTYTPDPRYRSYAELVSLSRHYYLYKKSLIYHLYNQATNITVRDGEFDLLALLQLGEPVELYSNVQGGLGLFVAYTATTREYVYVR
jgi:hypothetical protein